MPTREDFGLLGIFGCRSPMEGWPGDRAVYQVYDGAGFVELVLVADAADGVTEAQAAALTAALGEPVVAAPSAWDYVAATVWAWWPHLLILAVVTLLFTVSSAGLRRMARKLAGARERREQAATL